MRASSDDHALAAGVSDLGKKLVRVRPLLRFVSDKSDREMRREIGEVVSNKSPSNSLILFIVSNWEANVMLTIS